MALKPLNDRVLVQPEDPPNKTPGGILLPDVAKANSLRGTVIAVGPGKQLDCGERVPPQVKVGYVIYYGYGGSHVKHDEVDYLMFKESDILAVIE